MTILMAGGAAPVRAPATPRPPNRVAQKITGRTYLSHSQITCMRTCPMRFSLQYAQQARPDFVASSLLFGGAIHHAIEIHLRARLEGLGTTQAALLSAYHDAWNRQKAQAGDDVPVRFNKGQTIDTLHAMADHMLAAFLNSPLAQPHGLILGVEEQLQIVLDEELPDVLARVDLVTQTDGSIHVIDFKTSRSRWTDQKALESADQLLLYGVTVGGMSQSLGLPVHLHFAILTKTNTPIVQVIPVPTDAARVTLLKESVAAVWSAIQTGNYYPSPSPQNCAACPYRSRCPVFGGR